MSTSLEKYFHDHLAGAAFAIDLLGALCRKHENDPFGAQLKSLLEAIQADSEELDSIARKSGVEPGGMKESLARFMEKLSRPKLISSDNDIFSSFEACETLALGVLGKIALWDALSASGNMGMKAEDLARLRQRGESQHVVLEKIRLDLAALTFGEESRRL